MSRPKDGGKLVTRATVQIHDGGFLSHCMFTDFSQCLMASSARCIENNVTLQHIEAMTKLGELKEAIVAFYKKEELTI